MLPLARGIYSSLAQISRSSRAQCLHTASALRCKAAASEETEAADSEEKQAKSSAPDPKDRTQVIPVETAIRYLQSAAYKTTYGDDFVWTQYRRNHKGMYAPRKTRKTCIRQGRISSGNPCPICRDEYLVLDYRNTELLKQFISPYSGEVLSYSKTGLCQKSHLRLLVAVEKARDRGLITFDVPFREFDYEEYYGKQQQQQ
ncbi:hypothetical protein KR222_002914 [Zaprionus bogoriensis]|nr:hypothetical protein KR222_002914 [Zaprionus bogoriensis]